MEGKGNIPEIAVVRSVLAVEALGPLLAQAYARPVQRVTLIKALMLDTYLVEAEERFIFRIYPLRRRTRAEIEAEVSVLLQLQEAGAPLSAPLARADGGWLTALPAPEGERYGVLFSYAPGKSLRQARTAANVRAFGRALATVHALGEGVTMPAARAALDGELLLEAPLATLRATFPRRAADWEFLVEVAQGWQARVAGAPRQAPLWGLCHGDAGTVNANVTEMGEVTLFDFDLCGPGWRAYDVGTVLIDTEEETAVAFRQGYEAVRPLLAVEEGLLPWMQMAQQIWMLGMRAWHVNAWGSGYFADHFVDRVLDAIRVQYEQVRRTP
jgi:Ser/Thr protein kinase RdoA (MazF antagonist)